MNVQRTDRQIDIEAQRHGHLHIVTLTRPSHKEYFVTAARGVAFPHPFAELAAWLRAEGANVLSMDILGISHRSEDIRRAFQESLGVPACPLLWADDGATETQRLGGVQVWAISGLPVETLCRDGLPIGAVFEDADARYCRLSGVLPDDVSASPAEQAVSVFETMGEALADVGLDFSHVVRTWFYNQTITSWYKEFNEVRDRFFRQWGVFDGLVPASTGVGGHNSAGAALVAGALAVAPKNEVPRGIALPSPLQCPALEYGSSFSRAVELAYPDYRRVFISGTASISPDGESVYLGDVDGQVACTMEVGGAILESRGMSWADTTRAIAYFKNAADAPVFARYARRYGLPDLPVLIMPNDICRDDLLFEIELEAAAVGAAQAVN